MSNSPLVNYTQLSPNHSGRRTRALDMITPHCFVGQVTVQRMGQVFAPRSRNASCTYGIGKDGKYGMYVEECNRSWCTDSNPNDQRAVTIECASDATNPYAFNATVYNALVTLCVDICKRNGKNKLLWLKTKEKTWKYKPASNEMLLSVHRWYANKSCPGNWMFARMQQLADEVTSKLGVSPSPSPQPTPIEPTKFILGKYIYKKVDYGYVFNPTYYSDHYVDLKNAYGNNDKKLFDHFCKYGMKEGRQAIMTFNVYTYQSNYQDLRDAFGNDLPKYYQHFCQYGYKEGRIACGGPVVAVAPKPAEPTPMVPATAVRYTVKKGDSLAKIAKKYGTTADKIAKDNNIKNPNVIQVGQQLVIK